MVIFFERVFYYLKHIILKLISFFVIIIILHYNFINYNIVVNYTIYNITRRHDFAKEEQKVNETLDTIFTKKSFDASV